MRRVIVAAMFLAFPALAFAAECPEDEFYYKGYWIDGDIRAVDFEMSFPDLEKGTVGCYWVDKYSPWGIREAELGFAQVVKPGHNDGIMFAVYRHKSQIKKKTYVWLWLDTGTRNLKTFSRAIYSSRTKGLPR